MGFKDHGYYGYAFVAARPIQIVSLIVVIGMVGHFLDEDAKVGRSAPSQLVGTLVVSCLALLWTLASATAYDDTHFPFIVTAGVDMLMTIPFIVAATLLGGPLSATTCSSLPAATKENSRSGVLALPAGNPSSTDPKDYIVFVGGNQSTCYQIMAVWGFVISLCIVFAFSGIAMGLQVLGLRRAAAAARGPAPPPSRAGTIPPYGSGGYPGYQNESQIEMTRAYPKDFSDNGSIDYHPPSPTPPNAAATRPGPQPYA